MSTLLQLFSCFQVVSCAKSFLLKTNVEMLQIATRTCMLLVNNPRLVYCQKGVWAEVCNTEDPHIHSQFLLSVSGKFRLQFPNVFTTARPCNVIKWCCFRL